MKTIGHLIMEYDRQLEQWKPISEKERHMPPFFYSTTSAMQAKAQLSIKFPDVNFKIADVKM